MPSNYRHKAIADAKYAAAHLQDQIAASIIERQGPTNKTDMQNYEHGYQYEPDESNYSMTEAGALLDHLYEFEETDSSYWEGQNIRTAVRTAASLTFRNAVRSIFGNIIEDINREVREEIDPALWQFRNWYQSKFSLRRHGVLDWAPGVPSVEDLSEAQRDKLEAQQIAELARAVNSLVRRVIRKS